MYLKVVLGAHGRHLVSLEVAPAGVADPGLGALANVDQ